MVLVDYLGIFFYMLQYFCPHTLQHREWAFDRYKTDWFWVHVFLYFTWKKGKFIKLYLTTIAHQQIRKDNKLSSNI